MKSPVWLPQRGGRQGWEVLELGRPRFQAQTHCLFTYCGLTLVPSPLSEPLWTHSHLLWEKRRDSWWKVPTTLTHFIYIYIFLIIIIFLKADLGFSLSSFPIQPQASQWTGKWCNLVVCRFWSGQREAGYTRKGGKRHTSREQSHPDTHSMGHSLTLGLY